MRAPRPVRPGLPGGPDGPPSNRPKAASSIAPIALVLAVVLGIWLINGREPGTGTGSGTGEQIADGASYVGSQDPPVSPSGASTASATGGLPVVAAASLPVEARDVLDLIDAGGPFAYDEDGATFGNYEGLLPVEPGGYYAEYTVDTPGSDDRGARRIVAGDGGERYFTDDHYASFSVVAGR